MLRDELFELVKQIPKGEVITYKELAAKLGNEKLCRVVGSLLHTNDDPNKVPCHRVVNSKGETAKNYAFGGSAAQRKRLEEEGVVFDKNGRVIRRNMKNTKKI